MLPWLHWRNPFCCLRHIMHDIYFTIFLCTNLLVLLKCKLCTPKKIINTLLVFTLFSSQAISHGSWYLLKGQLGKQQQKAILHTFSSPGNVQNPMPSKHWPTCWQRTASPSYDQHIGPTHYWHSSQLMHITNTSVGSPTQDVKFSSFFIQLLSQFFSIFSSRKHWIL